MKVFRAFLLLLIFLASSVFVFAQTVDELNRKLDAQKAKIEALDKEIQQKQKELLQIGGEKSTLQGAIKTLELARNKLATDIKKTESSIDKAETTLQKLGIEIDTLTKKETGAKSAIASGLRMVHMTDSESPIEIILSGGSMEDFWINADQSIQLNNALQDHIAEIKEVREELKDKHTATEAEKDALLKLKRNLSGQKSSVESTKKEKDTLLTQTKNKESEYQRILQEKIAQKSAFEKALFDIESQLKIALDPKSFAAAKNSILSWPLDRVVITQLFGRTTDAKRLYASGTHNGVDFGVPDGTPIKAALGGTILATGNTDNGKCYSYGKWIVINHPNGLSTLYAHLSGFNVGKGDSVNTGDTIGYSGRTGYATGPHLHFTVYATQGMRVQQYTNSINCKDVSIPVADPKAYLDPMVYLPSR